MNVADLEAECIVFATEGLLLADDFISDCGIRVEQESQSGHQPSGKGKGAEPRRNQGWTIVSYLSN
jgi:hypothetical protein